MNMKVNSLDIKQRGPILQLVLARVDVLSYESLISSNSRLAMSWLRPSGNLTDERTSPSASRLNTQATKSRGLAWDFNHKRRCRASKCAKSPASCTSSQRRQARSSKATGHDATIVLRSSRRAETTELVTNRESTIASNQE